MRAAGALPPGCWGSGSGSGINQVSTYAATGAQTVIATVSVASSSGRPPVGYN